MRGVYAFSIPNRREAPHVLAMPAQDGLQQEKGASP
jgi:hypothetical protein